MEMLKFGKFAALALAMAVAVGCSSKGGDNAGEGAAVDPNAGYGANTGAVDGSLSEEAALRAITTFYFEYDSSDLKPEAMRALDVHAKDLKSNGNRVVLEGNTDERGTREYNLGLGERRGNAVSAAIQGNGGSAGQISVISYGEERPTCAESSEDCWQRNRRVEIVYTTR